MATREPKLYALPGSHPCAAVEAALQLKSIAYKRVDLLPTGEILLGPLLFGGTTVPGMRIDGERLVGVILLPLVAAAFLLASTVRGRRRAPGR